MIGDQPLIIPNKVLQDKIDPKYRRDMETIERYVNGLIVPTAGGIIQNSWLMAFNNSSGGWSAIYSQGLPGATPWPHIGYSSGSDISIANDSGGLPTLIEIATDGIYTVFGIWRNTATGVPAAARGSAYAAFNLVSPGAPLTTNPSDLRRIWAEWGGEFLTDEIPFVLDGSSVAPILVLTFTQTWFLQAGDQFQLFSIEGTGKLKAGGAQVWVRRLF